MLQLLDDVTEFESLFDMTMRGIEEHLINDEPDTARIMNALILLDKQLTSIIEAALERAQEGKCSIAK